MNLKSRSKTGGSKAVLSTGYRTVYIARRFCQSITMFGFIDANWCRRKNGRRPKNPYHYYASKVPRSSSDECDVYRNVVRLNKPIHQHDFVGEKLVFRSLALIRKPSIRFIRPAWNLTFA